VGFVFSILITNDSHFLTTNQKEIIMRLIDAPESKEYIIERIDADDKELESFLFSLGCYSGEPITVISHRRSGCTVAIKDGRYNIDRQLAASIFVEEA
jgi:ferrous iron transport protein A